MDSKVAFSKENGMRCICTDCPVEKASQCAIDKKAILMEKMGIMGEEKMEMPTREELAGLYCSSGKATCTDLKVNENCNCQQCPVWKENDLEHAHPAFHYCRDGKAM